jgi:hypothetical protein
VVADALNRKHQCNHLTIQPHTSCCDPEELSIRVVPHGRLSNIALIPTMKEDVIAAQRTDVIMSHICCLMAPKDLELHCKIMDEAHCCWYSIHPRTNKMYQNLKESF